MQKETSHIVILTPGFAADESDESCLTCLQYYILNLRKVAPQKKISIIAFEYPYTNKSYNWQGVRVYALGGKGKNYFWKIITWTKVFVCFFKLNKKNKVSSLQSFWLRECTLVGLIISKLYSLNFIATLQGQESKNENWYLKLFRFFNLKVVSNSQFNAKEYTKSTGKNCVAVIPFGVDYESLYRFHPLQQQARTIDIVGVGSLLPVKNYKLFLQIIKELKTYFPALKAVLIGFGPQQIMLQQKIISMGLVDTVKMTGFVESRSELLHYLNDSKIMLHTSLHEGQCYAFMEAFAYGLELVSFHVGHIPDSAKSHICATKEEMIECLKTLLSTQIQNKVEKIGTMQESAEQFNTLLI